MRGSPSGMWGGLGGVVEDVQPHGCTHQFTLCAPNVEYRYRNPIPCWVCDTSALRLLPRGPHKTVTTCRASHEVGPEITVPTGAIQTCHSQAAAIGARAFKQNHGCCTRLRTKRRLVQTSSSASVSGVTCTGPVLPQGPVQTTSETDNGAASTLRKSALGSGGSMPQRTWWWWNAPSAATAARGSSASRCSSSGTTVCPRADLRHGMPGRTGMACPVAGRNPGGPAGVVHRGGMKPGPASVGNRSGRYGVE